MSDCNICKHLLEHYLTEWPIKKQYLTEEKEEKKTDEVKTILNCNNYHKVLKYFIDYEYSFNEEENQNFDKGPFLLVKKALVKFVLKWLNTKYVLFPDTLYILQTFMLLNHTMKCKIYIDGINDCVDKWHIHHLLNAP